MQKNIRNIAVIAHVDHGKTTLIDALLKQTQVFRENQLEMSQNCILDSNDLEKERGITIMAKNCAIEYCGVKINIIDTPGHADFSGEVERILNMVEGALLIVDAQEGPMPQTKFVLKKALELDLKIIVVVNKIDKKMSRTKEVIGKIADLFLELAQNEKQLEFPSLFAVGRKGFVLEELPENIKTIQGDTKPLLEAILKFIPSPQVDVDKPAKMLVSALDYDAHLGQIVIGKIHQGKLQTGQKLVDAVNPNKSFTIERLMSFKGIKKQVINEASAGEIIALSGVSGLLIGTTLTDKADLEVLKAPIISQPSLHMTLGPNTSPFVGKEGKFCTSRQLQQRLEKELESNLSLGLEKLDNGKFRLSGRGELHLAILLETLRREGFEMEVGKPEVITKTSNGIVKEPIEELTLLVDQEFIGAVTKELGKRMAETIKINTLANGQTEMVFKLPTGNLIGLRSLLLTLTKGTLLFSSEVVDFKPVAKSLPKLRKGVLISALWGDVLAYGLQVAQGRGLTFVKPGEKVYEGQIIGQNNRNEDVLINVCKGKNLTNMRSKSSDGIVQLSPPVIFSLEQALDFLESDELLEITPLSLRLRKKYLREVDRRRVERKQRNKLV